MGLFTVTKQATTPFDGQKPGTSGLRKKVSLSPPDLCLRSL
jgi:phosphoglucomutase